MGCGGWWKRPANPRPCGLRMTGRTGGLGFELGFAATVGVSLGTGVSGKMRPRGQSQIGTCTSSYLRIRLRGGHPRCTHPCIA